MNGKIWIFFIYLIVKEMIHSFTKRIGGGSFSVTSKYIGLFRVEWLQRNSLHI